MLMVNFTYNEVQNILYSLTQVAGEANNPKYQEGFLKAAKKIKETIRKKGIWKYHEEGEKEKQIEVNDFRLNDMVKQ